MLSPLLAIAAWALCPQDPEPATATVRITATVLNDAFEPMPGVGAIVVGALDEGLPAALDEPIASSDPNGVVSFQVEVPQNSTRWVVFGRRGLAMQARKLRTRASNALDLGPFAMAPGVVLAGRARDPQGKPIVGATITATDLLDKVEYLDDGRSGQTVAFRTAARSDASGLFRLPGMVRSMGRVEVSAPGYLAETIEPVNMTTPIDAVLRPAPLVSGVLRDGNGDAVAQARVYCDREVVTTSAGDGTFSFHLPRVDASSFSASATVGGTNLSCRRSFTFDEWGTDLEFELTPRQRGEQQTLEVRAVDRNGDPVAEFRAVISWNPDDELRYRPDALLLARRSDPDSDWVADSEGGVAMPSGEAPQASKDVAMVYVLANGFGLGRVQLTRPDPDEPIVVRVPREVVVRGRVSDEVSGEPIQGVRVIPTQRLTDRERESHTSGYRDIARLRDCPLAVETDADGRYELRGLARGKTDLLLHHPDRMFLAPLTLDLRKETHDDVNFHLRPQVELTGRIEDAPPGSQVRLHWHRPNMWSSDWSEDFSGARTLTSDGAFELENLHPKPWEVQVLVSAPPRGGRRLKIPTEIWTPPEPGEDARPLTLAGPRLIGGKVGGDAPWHRLAVTVLWNRRPIHSHNRLTLDNPVALLGPNRSFRMFAPRQEVAILVFDAWTGAPLHWQELGEDAENTMALDLACAAVPLELLVQQERVDPAVATCEIEIDVLDDDWPQAIRGMRAVRGPFDAEPNQIRARARIGEPTKLWLLSRDGTLRVKHSSTAPIEVELGGETKLEVSLPDAGGR